jgi:hypothetical protein
MVILSILIWLGNHVTVDGQQCVASPSVTPRTSNVNSQHKSQSPVDC